MNGVEKLNRIVSSAKNIVFFGGAGVSTESGIPDFRSADGLYNEKTIYPPETILSHDFFLSKTAAFYEFYKTKMIFLHAEPNACHIKLALLEKNGPLKAVVTQNIDGLHRKAGSENVFELHGSVYRNHCVSCGKKYGVEKIIDSVGVPFCVCGGVIKPDVVLYGETLDENVVAGAIGHIGRADVLIVGGTSLGVYPAAGLCGYFNGKSLVLINKTETHLDRNADLIIRENIGEVFSRIDVQTPDLINSKGNIHEDA